jgi:hypothetical protein
LTHRTPEYIPIDGTRLILTVFEGNGPRFARLFAETWRMIPAADRDAMERRFQRLTPPITLGPAWTLRRAAEVRSTDAGDITEVCFRARAIDYISDADVRFVVAHELAHIRQWDDPEMAAAYERLYANHNDDFARSGLEIDADRRAMSWVGEHPIDTMFVTLGVFALSEQFSEQLPIADLPV